MRRRAHTLEASEKTMFRIIPTTQVVLSLACVATLLRAAGGLAQDVPRRDSDAAPATPIRSVHLKIEAVSHRIAEEGGVKRKTRRYWKDIYYKIPFKWRVTEDPIEGWQREWISDGKTVWELSRSPDGSTTAFKYDVDKLSKALGKGL